ncbi:hypothetical protein [Haloarcula montana]|uniref:hypothetical protein n=1 Tax=Haloarcula montana TaxID=3111776 RepID=UPI002D769185|nr:hypothetical protein [Haloarcula sp. GH36]
MVSLSRRAVLRSGLLAGVAAFAGCGGSETPSTGTTPSPTPTETPLPSVFEDIEVEGEALVVRLVDDHEVSKVNLIAPDGTLFGQTTVPTGATTARIEILDINWGLASYDHYEPGRYTLVAVLGSDSVSVPIDLNPELRILDISQYRAGERTADLAQIAVRIENVGTGPTWVYDIAYRNALSWDGTTELSGPGIPGVTEPTTPDGVLLSPGEEQTYVGSLSPLLVTDAETEPCDFEREMDVIVGIATGQTLEQTVKITGGGESRTADITGNFVCSTVEVESVERVGSTEPTTERGV